MGWLNNDGLTHFWEKIKTALAGKLDKTATARKAASIPMGQVDATSTSTAFTATVDGITELHDGVCMWLRNAKVTSAEGFTLNINGLGAKPVYGSLAASTRSTTIFNVNYTMLFIYNSTRVSGGCWDCVYGYDSNTNTVGYQLRTNSTSLPVSSTTYRYRLLFTSADGTHFVPANNSTNTNATGARWSVTEKIDPFGAIRYYGATAVLDAEARPSAASLWEQYIVTLGYSFNRTGAALALTSWKPVYVKATPQADGSCIINSAEPYVQMLPTTDDSYIYIFLGVAVSAISIELVPEHPVYCYRNGGIQKWTGVQNELSQFSKSYYVPAPGDGSKATITIHVKENDAWLYIAYGKIALISCNSAVTTHVETQISGALPTVEIDNEAKTITITNNLAWQPIRLFQLGEKSYAD